MTERREIAREIFAALERDPAVRPALDFFRDGRNLRTLAELLHQVFALPNGLQPGEFEASIARSDLPYRRLRDLVTLVRSERHRGSNAVGRIATELAELHPGMKGETKGSLAIFELLLWLYHTRPSFSVIPPRTAKRTIRQTEKAASRAWWAQALPNVKILLDRVAGLLELRDRISIETLGSWRREAERRPDRDTKSARERDLVLRLEKGEEAIFVAPEAPAPTTSSKANKKGGPTISEQERAEALDLARKLAPLVGQILSGAEVDPESVPLICWRDPNRTAKTSSRRVTPEPRVSRDAWLRWRVRALAPNPAAGKQPCMDDGSVSSIATLIAGEAWNIGTPIDDYGRARIRPRPRRRPRRR